MRPALLQVMPERAPSGRTRQWFGRRSDTVHGTPRRATARSGDSRGATEAHSTPPQARRAGPAKGIRARSGDSRGATEAHSLRPRKRAERGPRRGFEPGAATAAERPKPTLYAPASAPSGAREGDSSPERRQPRSDRSPLSTPPQARRAGPAKGIRARSGDRRGATEAHSLRPRKARRAGPAMGIRARSGDRRGATEAHSLRRQRSEASCGGESGIRTHGRRITPTHAFQACSINHSDISPRGAPDRAAGSILPPPRRWWRGSRWARLIARAPAPGRAAARTLCNLSLRTASGPEGSSAK